MHVTVLALLLLASAQPLDTFLDCQRRAAGDRMLSRPPVAVEVELKIQEPTFTVNAVYRATRAGQMRIDVFAEGRRVFAEALDGASGWQWRPGEGVSAATAQATAALRHGIELPGRFFAFGDLAARGHKIVDRGERSIGPRTFRVLNVVLDDGHEREYWLGAENCLVSHHRDVRALHPDVDPKETTIETRLSDYRRADGLAVAFKAVQTDVDSGKWLGTTQVNAFRVDPDLSGLSFTLEDLSGDER